MAFAYSGAIALLMIFEDRIVFPRGGFYMDVAEIAYEETWIKTSDGEKLNAWICPNPDLNQAMPASERWAVIFFHGNGGDLCHRYVNALNWQKVIQGDVLLVDYRGFGKSTGSPSEAGLYIDARSTWQWMVEERGYSPSKLILVGQSLGGAVAVQLATEKHPAALVLESTFTRLTDAASEKFPWLPVRWMMRNRFDSIDKIARYKGPVFILHGDKDELVPFDHSTKMLAAIVGPKDRWIQPDSTHNAVLGSQYYRKVKEFLTRHALNHKNG